MPYDFSRLNDLNDSDLQPVMPEFQAPKPHEQPKIGGQEITREQAAKGGRQTRELYMEQQAGKGPLGWLTKPMVQMSHTLASPDMVSGRLFVDPINALSKFGNWLGDKVQGRPGDVSDAWLIPNRVREIAPMRLYMGDEVTEADKAANGLAGAVMPTVLSHVLGYGYANDIQMGLRALGGVRALAVAAKTSPALSRALNIGSAVGSELVINAAALPMIDPQQGTLANAGDALGWNLPGRVDPTDTYGQAIGKAFAVEGLAAPLALIGGLSLIKPFRRTLTEDSRAFWNTTFWETMGDAGLLKQYDYNPNIAVGPQQRPMAALPSGTAPAGAPQLPAAGLREPGGALAVPLPETPYGSAIERNLADATQVRQVQQQRQRLQEAGLLEMGANRQLELSVGGAVDPETKLQIRALQMERGQVLKRASDLMASGDEAGAKALDGELTRIDTEIADLTLNGTTADLLAPPARQGEFDLTVPDAPDTRPEIDTFLAQLDELDDSQLREIHSQVWRDAADKRNNEALLVAQERVSQVQVKLDEVDQRLAAGDLTTTGAKRLTTKIQKELELAQLEVAAVEMRMRAPEPLVGDQLRLSDLSQQLGLDLSDPIQLPPFREITRTASEFGYRTADDYRSALQGWNRDLLRRLAMPSESPEVAALVQLRTGRRVWQAKKQDIIDALVELSERRNAYLPPEPPTPTQLGMDLKTNPVGGDSPLLDRPADLSAPGMSKTLDADGNEVSVPMGEYIARGMDPETRERMRMEILSKAIQNGEVQAPITPIPQRPGAPEFLDQSSFLKELFSDPTGQMSFMYATDQLPIYEAGGKNAAALVDEMRLRFQYARLDNEAAQAQKDAFMAAHGWDTLSWEEKKRLGLLGQGMFQYDRYDLIKHGSDVVRPPTPLFNPELKVTEGALPPKRPPAAQPDGVMLVNREGVPTAEPVGKAKPSAAQANAQAAAAKKAAKAADAVDKDTINQAQAARQDLLKRRERLAKQAQGASC